MPRRIAPFRQQDIARALRAARASGLEVASYEIDPMTGRIVIKIINAGGEDVLLNDVDKWLKEHAS
jgi:hypothetical protein